MVCSFYCFCFWCGGFGASLLLMPLLFSGSIVRDLSFE